VTNDAGFNSGNRIEDHFVDGTEMIAIGDDGRREVNVSAPVAEK